MKKIIALFVLVFAAATTSVLQQASAQIAVTVGVSVTTYAFPCDEIVRTINGYPVQVYDPVCVNRIVDPVEFFVEPTLRASYIAAVNTCYFPGQTLYLNPACVVSESSGPWLMIRDRWAPINVGNWPGLAHRDYHPVGRGIDRPVVIRDRGFGRGGRGGRGDLDDLNKLMDQINGVPSNENASVKQSTGMLRSDDATTESSELKVPALGSDPAIQAL